MHDFAFKITMIFSLSTLIHACRPNASDSSPNTYAISPSEWSVLETWNGLEKQETFRLSTVSSSSRCLLPGSEGLREQSCGSLAGWKIRRNVTESGATDAIKMIQSIHGDICITIDKKGKDSVFRAFTKPCDNNDKTQWLTLLNSNQLARFDNENSNLVFPTNTGSVSIFTANYKPEYFQHVDRSALIAIGETKGSDSIASESVFTERSAVYWGHVPAIKRIGVALDTQARAITAIEIERHGGKKEILGTCEILQGRCRLSSSDHVFELKDDQAVENAAIIRSGETISGIKFRIGSLKQSTSPIEFEVISSNADRNQNDWQWLDESDEASATARHLANLSDRVLAGFTIHARGLGLISTKDNRWKKNRSDDPNFIKAISGIFIDRKAYSSHNTNLFTDDNSGQSSPIAYDSNQVIGLKDSDMTIRNLEKINKNYRHLIKNLHDSIFSSQMFKFNTAFSSDEFRSQQIGRIYICGKSLLTGLFVLPKVIGETNETEKIGRLDCQNQKTLSLDSDEYITRVWWKPIQIEQIKLSAEAVIFHMPKPSEYLLGQRIGALRFDTNKQKAKAIFESDILSYSAGNWILAFNKPGYAISGFSGYYNTGMAPEKFFDYKSMKDAAADLLKLEGIYQLKPIFKKIDGSLPPPKHTDINIYHSDLFGKSKGEDFDPSYWLSSEDRIRSISIWQHLSPTSGRRNESSYIHAVGMSYTDQKQVQNGITLGSKTQLTLQDDEYITKLEIYTGSAPLQIPEATDDVILGIAIFTNQNRSFKAGLPADEFITRAHKVFNIDLKNETLLGFYGRKVGKGLGSLGLILTN